MAPAQIVERWFGDEFKELHPLLQKLHLAGGKLSGTVQIRYGMGFARVIGKRLARKMSLPEEGEHHLTVHVYHQEGGMHWQRNFSQQSRVTSLFIPVGNKKKGYWLEKSGPFSLKLTVDIKNGGWYWRCLGIEIWGFRLPRWFTPSTTLYKVIDDSRYRFHVEFSFPLMGHLLSYHGLLNAEYGSER